VRVALLLALLAGARPTGPLGALEARRRAEEAAARMLARQERSVLDTLGEAEAALVAALAETARVEGERAAAEASLRRAQHAEAEAQQRLRARLGALRPRLLARSRMGAAGALPVLLSSASLGDLVKRRYLLDRILARDATLLGEAKAALSAREQARATQEREAGRLAALAREVGERRAIAEARREERETLLAALRTARGFHERAAAEAVAQAQKLATLVGGLGPAGAPAPGVFAARRGKLPRPADGPITVGFGRVVDPRFNTVTVQNGLDIAARSGAPVRAVAPGRVAHAGWFKGYGNLVILDHGDGYHTLVAHLGSMRAAMGVAVEAGAVLGTVGDSGSLKGAYLYFEVREKGRPVDPRPWLAR
jgi:septal ring factor EnvC (AmiA/AmiB activator)